MSRGQFVKGQPRSPRAGRRKGSKPLVPQTLKAVIDRLGTDRVDEFETAMLRGLRARPPFSAPYLKIIAERVLGPVPKEAPPPGNPFYLVFLKGALGYDPLALPPPQPVEGIEVGQRRTLELPPAPVSIEEIRPLAPTSPPPPPAVEDLDAAIVPEPEPPRRRRG